MMAHSYQFYRGTSVEHLLDETEPLLSQDLFAPLPLLVTHNAQMAQRCRRILVKRRGTLFGLTDVRPSHLPSLLPDFRDFPPLFHDREQLTFAVWNLLERLPNDGPQSWVVRPLSRYIEQGLGNAPLWRRHLAVLIAQVFTDYLNCEAGHLECWEQGRLSGINAALAELSAPPEDVTLQDECWQLFLWRQVRQKLETLVDHTPESVLPPLLLVGTSRLLTPYQSRVVEQLCQHTPVLRLLIEGRSFCPGVPQAEEIRDQWQALSTRQEATWMHREPHELDNPQFPPTALGRLQGFLTGVALPANRAQQDQSIACHACAGNWRQTETLRDQLLAWFEQNPDCPAHEVAVLAPRIDTFAPCIAAVFAASPTIPYRLVDVAAGHDAPLLQAFFDLLKLPSQHFRLDQVAQLLLNPCFGQLGDEEEREQWVRIFERLSIRYGYTDEDLRQQEIALDNSWRTGIQRLIAILLAPEDESGPVELVGLTRLHDAERWVNQLEEMHASLKEAVDRPRGLDEWVDWAEGIIESYLHPRADHPRDALDLKRLRNFCQYYRQSTLPFPGGQPLEVFADLLEQSCSSATFSGGGSLWGDGVFCASVDTAHALHFRAIFVLGMDDGVFPSAPIIPSFALTDNVAETLALERQNHLFYHMLLAAEEKICFFYNGQDALDGRVLPPSVLLRQLRRLLDLLLGEEPESPTASWPIRHPLHASSRSYFSAASELFSYDLQAESSARIRFSMSSPSSRTDCCDNTRPESPSSVELRFLRNSLAQPQNIFWKKFNPLFASQALPAEIGILTPPYFSQHQQWERLVKCWWGGRSLPPLAEWLEEMRDQGILPLLSCTHQTRQQLEQGYHQLSDIFSRLSPPQGERATIQFCAPEQWGAHYHKHLFLRPGLDVAAQGSVIVGTLDECAICYHQNRWLVSRCYYRPGEWAKRRYDGLFDALLVLTSYPGAVFCEYEISPDGAGMVSYGASDSEAQIQIEDPAGRLAMILELYLQGSNRPWYAPAEDRRAIYPDWPRLSAFFSSLAEEADPHSVPLFWPIWKLCGHRDNIETTY